MTASGGTFPVAALGSKLGTTVLLFLGPLTADLWSDHANQLD